MKKIGIILLTWALLAASATVQAQFGYSTNADNTLTLTNYTGGGGNVVIPTNFNGLIVADIGAQAFYGNTNVTGLTIPDTILSVGNQAFFACGGLTNLTIADSVTNISIGAFELCTNLPQIVLPNLIPAINATVFEYCTHLTNVVFPTNLTSIGDSAFYGCSSLASIVIPSSVTNIGNAAFYNCTALTNVVIPNSVQTLGSEAFESCTALTSVVIPDSVVNIGFGTFSYAANLTNVVIPATVTNIGGFAFVSCTSLSNVAIPGSVTNIGTSAFQGCTNLATVSFASNAPAIGSNIFGSDSAVTVYYPPGATGFGTNFAGTSATVEPVGSLEVVITPSTALSAGAQWQVDGGSLQDSGTTITNLSVGTHSVSFVTITNWTTPADQTITISNDLTTTVNALYAPSVPGKNGLTLLTNGFGTIQHGAWPQHLVLGKKYSATASPKPGNLFAYWTVGTTAPYTNSNSAAQLSFIMQSNLLLEANFVTNSFLATHGTFRGLFAPTNSPREQTNSGSFTFNVSTGGAVSGSLDLGGRSLPFSGKFSYDGVAQIPVKSSRGLSTLATTWNLNFVDQSVSGSISNADFVAALSGDENAFTGRTKATNYEGKYTWTIAGTTNSTNGPFGTSYGIATVTPAGAVTLAGGLADGTSISQSSEVSKDGRWPLYVKLYGGEGSLWGWIYFTNSTLSAESSLSWINATNTSKAALYRSGFTNYDAVLSGGLFVPTLSLPTGLAITFSGGGLSAPLEITSLSGNTNKLTLSTNKANGLISGSFANPADAREIYKFKGVILQNETNAQGYFLGTNQSGRFEMSAAP